VDPCNFRIKHSNNSHRIIWMQTQLPFILKRDGVDVLHSPCYNTPLLSGVPSVVTIHDMSSSIFPRQFVLKHRLIYSTLVPMAARKAARIIAVSTQTKEDIVRIFNVPEERVDVILEAANKEYYRRGGDEVGEIRKKYGIDSKYVLFVGTLQPRKNVVRLIKAYACMNAERDNGTEYKLVLAGKKGWFYKEIFETVKRLGIEEKVQFLGHVPGEDLPPLYSGASLFVFPSLYEGFGLPPLEAMSCGAPVIAADNSCFPEILGDAAILVDAESEESMKDGMLKALYDEAFHEKMMQDGFSRAKQFSWEKTAKETIESYRKAASVN